MSKVKDWFKIRVLYKNHKKIITVVKLFSITITFDRLSKILFDVMFDLFSWLWKTMCWQNRMLKIKTFSNFGVFLLNTMYKIFFFFIVKENDFLWIAKVLSSNAAGSVETTCKRGITVSLKVQCLSWAVWVKLKPAEPWQLATQGKWCVDTI